MCVETITVTLTADARGAARAANLQHAHQVRTRRACVKRALASGATTIAAAMEDPSCQTMRILDLLACQPKWGRARTLRTVDGLRISEPRLVGQLMVPQRALIAGAVT